MWNGNYLNLDQFMAEAHDRFRFFEHELEETRVKEWLYKAMELIGVVQVYPSINKEEQLTDDEDIKLSYVNMPEGIIRLNGVVDDCKRSLIHTSALTGWNDQLAPPSYQLNGNVMLTNLCGNRKITLNYDSFPIDTNGNPMVPDDTVYIEAMLSYLGYRMGYELWMMDRLPEAKYRELEREWLFYVNSAKTKILMPSYDESQSLVHQQNQIAVSPRHHAGKFRFLNYPHYSR